jgi:hypothetical protein
MICRYGREKRASLAKLVVHVISVITSTGSPFTIYGR